MSLKATSAINDLKLFKYVRQQLMHGKWQTWFKTKYIQDPVCIYTDTNLYGKEMCYKSMFRAVKDVLKDLLLLSDSYRKSNVA